MDIIKGGTLSGTTTVAATKASTERDRAVFILPSHTVKEPRVVIFSRQVPSGLNDKEVFRATIKTVFGDRNADGTPKSGNVIIETTVRVPQDQDNTLALEALEHHSAVVRDSSITDNLVEQALFPAE